MQSLLFGDADQSPLSEENTASSSKKLALLCDKATVCRKCSLAETRIHVVFGEGNPSAALAVIGEAPGAEEDASGRPFVGRSGQLLDKILKAAGFARQEVYICNILKCRPPGNRNPLAHEIESCIPFLLEQVQIVKPKVILILGKVAANTIFDNKVSLGSMRGKVIKWKEFDCFITYHPAALLRNPEWKRGCWEDIQLMMSHYEKICGKTNASKHEH